MRVIMQTIDNAQNQQTYLAIGRSRRLRANPSSGRASRVHLPPQGGKGSHASPLSRNAARR